MQTKHDCMKYMPESPYKGLMPYSQTDRLFFFGRDHWRKILINNLKASRLTILYGTSGIGKSSVLRAGVAYYLQEAAKENFREYSSLGQAVIVYPPTEKESFWSKNLIDSINNQIKLDIASLLDELFSEEEFSFVQKFQDWPSLKVKERSQVTSKIAFLLHFPVKELSIILEQILSLQQNLSFVQTLECWTKFIGKYDKVQEQNTEGKEQEKNYRKGQLFIILDQFEEYLFTPDYKSHQSFASELVAAINKSDLNVNFLIALRDDALSALDAQFKGKIPNLLSNRLQIHHLDEKSAREAIEKPIAEYNRQAIILENFLNSKLTVLCGDTNTYKSSLLSDGIFQYLKQAQLSVKMLDCWYDRQELSELIVKRNNQLNNDAMYIILDQFEECFWYQQEDNSGNLSVKDLLDKINQSSQNTHWLISLNQKEISKLKQAISECNVSKDLSVDKFYLELFENQGKQQIRQVFFNINEPEKIEKRLLETYRIDSGLIQGIFAEFTEQESEIETFLLQLVMSEIWQASDSPILKEKNVEKLGSYKQILRNYILSKLGNPLEPESNPEVLLQTEQTGFPLSYKEQDIAESIFHQLVSPGEGGKIAHTVSTLLDFANEYRKNNELELLEETPVKRLLDKLSDSKVRIIRPLPEERYEIFHDVLAQPILNWSNQYQQQQTKNKLTPMLTPIVTGELLLQYGKEHFVNQLTEAAFKLRDQTPVRQDELMALLARQAFLLNHQYNAGKIDAVDEALRQTMNRPYFSPMLHGHKDEVSSVTFSPDSKLFASGSYDGTIKLWDLKKKQCINTFSTGLNNRGVLSIAISPDGETLAVGCGDHKVRVFDLKQPTNPTKILKGHTNEVWSVAFHPKDSKLLASGSWDTTVRLWDLRRPEDTEEICRIDPLSYPDYLTEIWSIAFSTDGETLAAGCCNGTICLLSLNHAQQLELIKTLRINGSNSHQWNREKFIEDLEIFSVAFNNDGTRLAAGSGDGKVRLWDWKYPDNPSIIISGCEHLQRSMVAFSFDGQWLAAGSGNGIVKLWKLDYDTITPLLTFKAHYKGVSSVAFSRDGKWLGSGSWDCTARLWEMQSSKTEPIVLAKHQDQITTIAFSPDGKKLASGGKDKDKTLVLWDLQDRNPKLILDEVHHNTVNAVAFSCDGKKLASGSADKDGNNGEIWLWDLEQLDEKPRILKGHDGQISALAFRPHDPNILVSGSWNNTVKIWDLREDKIINTLNKHEDHISSVAFSPNSNILATSSDDRTVRLWNLTNLHQPNPPSILLPSFHYTITSVAFNKKIALSAYGDSQLLAISTDDNKIQMWNITPLVQYPDAEPIFLRQFSSSEDQSITGSPVVFSPDDGYILASGNPDNNVCLWDLRQFDVKPVALEGHRDKITTLAFSPDGQWIAAGSLDKNILLWSVKTETIADLVCQKVWRNLTKMEWEKYVGKDIPYQRTCPNLPQEKVVAMSERDDISRRAFQQKIDKLMPKQKALLQLITDNLMPKGNDPFQFITDQKQDLSEADIARLLEKNELEKVDFIGLDAVLDALCQLEFLMKKISDDKFTTSYSLSPNYRNYCYSVR